eukprot:TRINITY_DN88633_c0_g1_i1.p1 TRINITY_DN88633_c0_g1~~TRINITY_DN88633_c0_g1_i1.p1  ORF type:complete len:428 (-),score=10.20 TRINITY_DN88633_c0_g1_i1:25-1308(-)
MKSFLILLSLLSASYLVAGSWSRPKLLRTNDINNNVGIYTDNSIQRTYIFYGYTEKNGGNEEPYLCMKEYAYNEALVNELCIKQTRKINNVTATGDNDGKHIYVAFSAIRVMGATECSMSQSDGCMDVYFMESSDSGRSWSPPVAVPRTRMNDDVQRWYPKIVSVVEKSRLFIVFLKQWGSSSPTIAYVSRPAQSSIFTNEANIDSWSNLHDIGFTYTVKGNDVYLHIVCSYGDRLIRYVSNNYWTSRNTYTIRSDSRKYLFSLSATPERDNYYMTSMGENSQFMVHWLESDLSWHDKKLKIVSKPDGFRPVVVGLQGTNHNMLFTSTVGSERMSTYSFNTDYEFFEDLKDPAPVFSHPDAGAIATKDVVKVWVAHSIGNDLYASTYSYVIGHYQLLTFIIDLISIQQMHKYKELSLLLLQQIHMCV